MTHICVSKLTIIGSGNGLSPGRRQAIIWTNAGILWIGPLETNFSEILIGIQTLSFKKMHLKMSSAKWHPVCLGLNVLMKFCGIHLRAILKRVLKLLFCIMTSKIILCKLLSHLPGANELSKTTRQIRMSSLAFSGSCGMSEMSPSCAGGTKQC